MKKHKKPAGAVFDDHKDLELEDKAPLFDPDAPDVWTGLDSGAASVGEMTGLIPTGADLTEEEYEASKDLFPFGGAADIISGRQI
ncbi:MAG: hypothetical protein IKP95_06455 [Ruminococcus sp.]|nr:hypothetical protein [Ruminococcus sp.]